MCLVIYSDFLTCCQTWRGSDSNILAEQKWQNCLRDAGALFSHLYFLYTDCRNLIEDRHILKFTHYVEITRLLQGHETGSEPGVEAFLQQSGDVFLPCDVSRSKKTAQLLSVKSNLQRVAGTWELHHRAQKNILCTLCNKSRQRLCVLMRTEN